MKRSAFIAWLIGMAGIAEAQTTWESTGTTNWNPRLGTAENHLAPIDTHWSDAKPKNNQCPVCGTMAKAFKPEKPTPSNMRSYVDGHCFVVRDQGTTSLQMESCYDPPKERLIRCDRCNAAFFQDAVA